ncbi:MAG: AAA family ATPase [Saprospiraceae bacterium]|nr:AAA family ATPase [Saprospiraceae bacterium]
MLDHLHIKNYRLFHDLRIDTLGQVNLIAGKNNTGKTALLEAIRIVLSQEDIYEFRDEISLIITRRGDDTSTDVFGTIFNDFNQNVAINNVQISATRPRRLLVNHEGAEIVNGREQTADGLNFDYSARERINNHFTFVSIGIDSVLNDIFWQETALTSKEDDLIEILKVIDTRIKRINVNSNNTKVQLNDYDKPIPLKNLGDGANRLLTLALALVNSKNKVLLIDEFEVGLHHSIQEQLWDMIFKYAELLNIQVFVTTHSQDTVQAFYRAAVKTSQYRAMANYFTLHRKGAGDVKAIIYDLDEIETALLTNIEIR